MTLITSSLLGGGYYIGGGGGAGGVVSQFNITYTIGTYPVVIGNGGSAPSGVK